MWSAGNKNKDEDDDEEDSEEEEDSDEEEEDSDDDGKKPSAAEAEASREDRKAQKKARKEAAIARQKAKNVEVGDMPSSDEDSEEEEEEDDMPANPNHSKAARKQATAPTDPVEEVTEGVKKMGVPMSRREREAVEAAAAKERYMKLHAQGKTDEAKADLARLKVIREQRATEAARRQVSNDCSLERPMGGRI